MNLFTRTRTAAELYFSTPSIIIDALSRFGCWLVVVSQYFTITWLAESFFQQNWTIPILCGELLFISALRSLVAINLVRDMLEISFWQLTYVMCILICYEAGSDFYSVLTGHHKGFARFLALVFFLRLVWCFKCPIVGSNYAWPIIGLVGLFVKVKGSQPVIRERKHSILVYLTIVNAWLWANLDCMNDIKLVKLLFAMASLFLFFKYFHRYMRDHLFVVEALDTTKKELATTKEELAEVVEAKSAAEIELEQQRMLSTLVNKFSPDQIATLHEFTLMDWEMQKRFNNAIKAARSAQLDEEAERESKQKRAKLWLVVSDEDDTQ